MMFDAFFTTNGRALDLKPVESFTKGDDEIVPLCNVRKYLEDIYEMSEDDETAQQNAGNIAQSARAGFTLLTQVLEARGVFKDE